MKTIRSLRVLLLLLLAGSGADVLAAHPNCSLYGGTLLKWPATGAAVWEMCWRPPSTSSSPGGSGLELMDIHYKGIPIAKRIHSPIIFAEYNGTGTCYRDWKNTNAKFAVDPAVRNKLGIPVSIPTTTTCDVSKHATAAYGACPFSNLSPNPFTSADCLSPGGVAIEDKTNAENPGESYVLITTQYAADWYQYTSRVAFYVDGDINPEFGYGNRDGTFNNVTHWHHNYWRMDFDIAGADNDQISANDVVQATEFTGLRSLTGGPGGGPTYWEITDTKQNFGYRITSGTGDYTPPNDSGRGLHLVDVIGTRFVNNEYSDQPDNALSDCEMNANNLANGQSIADTDVVFYYTASVRDTTANNWPPGSPNPLPQDSMVCKRVGPMITPVGDWPIFRDDFQ